MAELNKNCITEEKNFNVSLINESRFNGLTPDGKLMFEALRNATLEIMPLYEGKLDEDVINIAEKFAFVGTNLLGAVIDKKLETFKAELVALIPAPVVTT